MRKARDHPVIFDLLPRRNPENRNLVRTRFERREPSSSLHPDWAASLTLAVRLSELHLYIDAEPARRTVNISGKSQRAEIYTLDPVGLVGQIIAPERHFALCAA